MDLFLCACYWRSTFRDAHLPTPEVPTLTKEQLSRYLCILTMHFAVGQCGFAHFSCPFHHQNGTRGTQCHYKLKSLNWAEDLQWSSYCKDHRILLYLRRWGPILIYISQGHALSSCYWLVPCSGYISAVEVLCSASAVSRELTCFPSSLNPLCN